MGSLGAPRKQRTLTFASGTGSKFLVVAHLLIHIFVISKFKLFAKIAVFVFLVLISFIPGLQFISITVQALVPALLCSIIQHVYVTLIFSY